MGDEERCLRPGTLAPLSPPLRQSHLEMIQCRAVCAQRLQLGRSCAKGEGKVDNGLFELEDGGFVDQGWVLFRL